MKNNIENKEKLVISVAELAKMLNLSRSKAYQLSRRSGFPVLKIGKRRLVPLSELHSWIHNNLENA